MPVSAKQFQRYVIDVTDNVKVSDGGSITLKKFLQRSIQRVLVEILGIWRVIAPCGS